MELQGELMGEGWSQQEDGLGVVWEASSTSEVVGGQHQSLAGSSMGKPGGGPH